MEESIVRKALSVLFVVFVSVGMAWSQAAQPESLYKRLGGYDALAAVTDDFIGRLASDPTLGKFFEGHSTASLQHIRQLIVDQL
jgi:hypothetical protein